MTRPDVSVVIPTFQRRAILPRTVEGVLRQEDVAVEVIVVDDGSAHDGPRGLPVLEDPRVRLVEHEVNRGQSVARNTGIGHATAPWVAFLDDDDLWAPRKLRLQLDAVLAQDAPFGFGSAVVVDADLRVTQLKEAPDAAGFRKLMLGREPIPAGASNVLVSAEVLARTGGFDAALHHHSDWDMWLRLAEHGDPAPIKDVVVAYAIHGANFSIRALDGVLAQFDDFVAKHAAAGRTIDRTAFLRWVAWNERIGGRPGRAAGHYLRAAWAGRDPSDVARAVTTVLGERLIRRLRPLEEPPAAAEPDWLGPYR